MIDHVRLLAGPFDGQRIRRPSKQTHCLFFEGVVYEYRELPDDPGTFGLTRWEPYWEGVERELQMILQKA
jgi:hypothetical protein